MAGATFHRAVSFSNFKTSFFKTHEPKYTNQHNLPSHNRLLKGEGNFFVKQRPISIRYRNADVATNAILGIDANFAVALAIPASFAIGMAYWLADKQDDIKPGDMMMVKDIKTEDETEEVSLDEESYLLGEPIKCDVGRVGEQEPRTFFIQRVLGDESSIIKVEVERPAGIVFEEDDSGLISIVEIIERTNAAQLLYKSQLLQQMDSAPQVGDVLRGFTTTTTVYDAGAISGASLPKREVQFIDADSLPWALLVDRLTKGRKADGPAQFVLERKCSQ